MSPTDQTTLFGTTDRNLAVLLIMKKICIADRVKTAFNRTKFFFNKEQAKPYVEMWKSGEKIPVDDIRDVFQAEVIFNSAVHDEI